MSLHREIRKKAANKQLRLAKFGPNSLEIAKRMISSGELLAIGNDTYCLNEVAHVKKKSA
jgi:hypothetical protein